MTDFKFQTIETFIASTCIGSIFQKLIDLLLWVPSTFCTVEAGNKRAILMAFRHLELMQLKGNANETDFVSFCPMKGHSDLKVDSLTPT